jgi:NAD(P)-dependent dehydrogenase (short-subunit alcohol dehydrogenase family)
MALMAVAIDMSGKAAIITGAAQGIGYETARLFGEAGASIMLADVQADKVERAAEELAKQGYDVARSVCDITSVEQTEAAAKATVEKWGRIDVLVNNAAFWTVQFFARMTPEEYEKDVAITLVGTMNMTRAVLAPMTHAKGGSIVNLISDSGRLGEARLSAYAAAKAGVIAFTKSIAKESARFGIRVNGVSPSTTNTPGAQSSIDTWGGAEKVARLYPLGRLGEPSDLANAILFFASPLTPWVTGQILSVNGGFAMSD